MDKNTIKIIILGEGISGLAAHLLGKRAGYSRSDADPEPGDPWSAGENKVQIDTAPTAVWTRLL
jgi:hypothetical protein